MSDPAAIRCEQLSKRFGDIAALKPMDLTVQRGSIFGFLGRNGAGKTTTIRLLAGLAKPTSGSAWIEGARTAEADGAAREKTGYLPQEVAFYNWMTPREYLDYVAGLFRMSREERRHRIEEMLELVGLQASANRRIGGFSGGMRQRLGIAQALIHRPPVLLLDEPISALDPAGRYAILELIGSLRDEVTVLLSSHILGDVERVCDTIGIIREGCLVMVAERDELLSRYAQDVIALEIDEESLVLIHAFTDRLSAQAWASSVAVEGAVVRITVRDRLLSKQALWPLVTEFGMGIDRYEWVRPSLEEIFMSVSE